MYRSEEPTTYLQEIPDTPDATSIHSSFLAYSSSLLEVPNPVCHARIERILITLIFCIPL